MSTDRFPLRRLAWILAAALIWEPSAHAQETRHALVIGNGAYEHARVLPNPPNDAKDVAAELRKAGWKVTVVEDAGVKAMLRALREFCELAEGTEAALFFYAGHGVEVAGKNYLLPVDASLAEADAQDALPLETLALDKVLRDLGAARIRLKTVVLDCCRDNPLDRSWLRGRTQGGGLAEVKESQLPEGAMLVYSTAPGRVAADGRGRNSPFTSALLERMRAGGGGISDVFGDVASALGTRQQAWIRFDGSGVSFTAFRDYPLVPGAGPGRGRMQPPTAADRARAATKEAPFVNSLGLEFVPLPGKAGVLMCRTETRVRDFRAYATGTGYQQKGGAFVMTATAEGTKWELDASASWEKPGFPQTEDHPVVCVSWDEAVAFCAWLSGQAAEKGLGYRLPTDAEWTLAVGSVGKYPWGNDLSAVNGNYWDQSLIKTLPKANWTEIRPGYDDGAARTARVGNYQENRFGFYDLGGNVCEWCQDWYRDSMNEADVIKVLKDAGVDDGGGNEYRVLRGGSWSISTEVYLRSSLRFSDTPTFRDVSFGFRVVLEVGSGG